MCRVCDPFQCPAVVGADVVKVAPTPIPMRLKMPSNVSASGSCLTFPQSSEQLLSVVASTLVRSSHPPPPERRRGPCSPLEELDIWHSPVAVVDDGTTPKRPPQRSWDVVWTVVTLAVDLVLKVTLATRMTERLMLPLELTVSSHRQDDDGLYCFGHWPSPFLHQG